MNEFEYGEDYGRKNLINKIEQMWLDSGMKDEEFGRKVRALLNEELMKEAHEENAKM